MKKQTEYKIYTEDVSAVNRSLIVKAISKHFKAFTMQTGTGYWESTRENSLQITIITDRNSGHIIKKIRDIAATIRDINGQDCVLLTATPMRGELI